MSTAGQIPRGIKPRTRADLRFPVGDVLNYGVYKSAVIKPMFIGKPAKGYVHQAITLAWWVPEMWMAEIRVVMKEWEKYGLKLCVGEAGKGTYWFPEVIEEEDQIRAPGRAYGPSTRGDIALVGDVLVWSEIEDTEELYKHIKRGHTDIPLAPRCDIMEYHGRYRDVFDFVNDLFQHYYVVGTPKDLSPAGRRDTYDDEDL